MPTQLTLNKEFWGFFGNSDRECVSVCVCIDACSHICMCGHAFIYIYIIYIKGGVHVFDTVITRRWSFFKGVGWGGERQKEKEKL